MFYFYFDLNASPHRIIGTTKLNSAQAQKRELKVYLHVKTGFPAVHSGVSTQQHNKHTTTAGLTETKKEVKKLFLIIKKKLNYYLLS